MRLLRKPYVTRAAALVERAQRGKRALDAGGAARAGGVAPYMDFVNFRLFVRAGDYLCDKRGIRVQ